MPLQSVSDLVIPDHVMVQILEQAGHDTAARLNLAAAYGYRLACQDHHQVTKPSFNQEEKPS